MTVSGSAAQRIYELAALHGIEAERLPIDAWADKVTELAGDTVTHDPVEDLVVTLQRKGIVTDRDGAQLYGVVCGTGRNPTLSR